MLSRNTSLYFDQYTAFSFFPICSPAVNFTIISKISKELKDKSKRGAIQQDSFEL